MKMKKLFAMAVMMTLGMVSTYAQVDETFQFVDANGNVVPDGSTVTFDEAEIEEGIPGLIEDKVIFHFDLKVKNTQNKEAYVAAHLVTEEMSSGSVQFCFPNQCPPYIPADFTSESGTFTAGEIRPLNSEWFPEIGKYGTARFTLQLYVMSRSGNFPDYTYKKTADGPKITINCIYSDPAGIANPESDKNVTVANRYNANGQVISTPQSGLKIIKMSNGEVRKVVTK